MTATTPTTRYVSVADTAKEIRKAVKVAFPGQKFSVRSSSYAGGASIDVAWVDGPAAKAVDDVVKTFAGASFDGMIDLKSYHESVTETGERVHWGADFVFTNRSISPIVEAVAEQVAREAVANDSAYNGTDFNRNTWYSVMTPYGYFYDGNGYMLIRFIAERAAETNDEPGEGGA